MSNYLKEYRYQVRVLDANDQVLAVYDDLMSLYYRKQVNNPGMAIMTVPEGHDILNYAFDDTLFEIFVSYPQISPAGDNWGQTWVSDFLGLYRDRQIATDGDGNPYHLLYVTGTIDILSRYVNAYPAGTNNKTQWTGQQLSIICNDIVRWNCTDEATIANGRIRNATLVYNLHDAGAISGTPVVNYSITPGRNILEIMQELAPICGFDFDVQKRGGFPGQLEYRQFAGQLGTDRSGEVVFDISLDNSPTVNLSFDGLREKTIAIVGGGDSGANRSFAVRVGPNYSGTNDYEVFVDGRSNDDSELDDLGDTRLGELTARLQMQNTIALTRGWVYRRDFAHGDLVTAQFAGTSQTKKIGITEVKFDQDQRCEIRLEFIEP